MRSAILFGLLAPLAGCSFIVSPGSDYLADGGGGGGRDAAVPIDADAGPFDAAPPPVDADAGPMIDASPDPMPPVGSGVGMSDYRPVLGQTLRALVGPYFDPNGDSVSVSYQWTRAGAPLSGETSDRLVLDEAAYAAGDDLGVTVTLSDGAMETTLEAGPAVIADDTVTRWRLLQPPRAFDGVAGFLDTKRQRLLFNSASEDDVFGLWEMQLGVDEPRWVRLESVEGTQPDSLGSFQLDPARDRALFFGGRTMSGGSFSNRLTVLQMADVQGSEQWMEVSATGDLPTPRVGETSTRLTLPDGEEVFFYFSGQAEDDSLHTDGFLLHVEGGGFRWEQLSVPLPPGRLGAVTFFDADNARLFLVGGIDESFSPSAEVYMWDLDDAFADGFTEVDTATLPHPVLLPAAIVEGDQAYLVGGARDLASDMTPTINDDFLTIDLSTLTSSAEVVAGGPGEPITVAPVSRAPFADDYVVFSRDFDTGGLSFHAVSPTRTRWQVVSADGETLPPPLFQGQAMVDSTRGLVLSSGRTSLDPPVASGDTWRFGGGVMERYVVSGEGPRARWGAVNDSFAHGRHRLDWFLGDTEPSMGLSLSIWQLLDGDSDWVERSVAVGESIPDPRHGHVIFQGVCAGGGRENETGVFGGRLNDTGTITNETWMSDCARGPGPGECTWFDPIEPSSRRPGAVWAAVTHLFTPDSADSRTAFVSGGLEAGGPTNRVTLLDVCNGLDSAGTQRWPEAAITGPAPAARFGHSTSAVQDAGGNATRAIWLFGGTDEDAEGDEPFGDIWRMEWNGDYFSPAVTFTELTAAGEAPPTRMYHLVAYDPAQNRLLVYGGLRFGDPLDDLWELRLRE